LAQEFYKKIYSIREFRQILFDAVGSLGTLTRARKNGLISKPFEERIMLAVTEVNGCEVCSYYHVSVALKEGMSNHEISAMLNGSDRHIPEEEGIGIMYAQHYADQRGKPDPEIWGKVVSEYGEKKAAAIAAAIKIIMAGNIYGMALGAMGNRLKGKPVKKTTLGYELGVIFGVLVFVPLSLVKLVFQANGKQAASA